ncbi:MAG: YeeE/YedE family protein, partial [Betaproteobacteria bacterium]|nr:YeeE/YedE family protein [Betaproteobacteria bacterium]
MDSVNIEALTRWVLWSSFAASFLFGALAQRTHFCTMGAISDVVNMGDWTRARQWMLAIGVAMLGFAVLSWRGDIQPGKSLYASTRLIWLSCLIGGLMFGFGMVLASGCGNKTLVRVGSGNLKALVVMVVMGVSAFATLKGITGVLRVSTVDRVALELPQGASLGGLLQGLLASPAANLQLLLGVCLGMALCVALLLNRDMRRAENLLAGAGTGVL